MKATQTHCRQYKRYGDSFYVWEIETQGESEEEVLKFCRENLYTIDIPSSAEWHANIRYGSEKSNDMSYYFDGYYELTKTENGYKFTVCEPYTD